MFFSTIASLIVFFLLFNFSSAGGSLLGTITLQTPEKARGEILNKAEEIRDFALPRLAQLAAREERLPISENKPIGPVKIQGASEFNLAGQNGIALDAVTSKIFFEKNIDETRPIASLTKLMTALVFLEHNPGWEEIYQIKAEDKREGGRIYLFSGEKIKIKDLFYSSLAASDNVATMALVSASGLGEEEFVAKMNAKARQLGLAAANFNDPIGLDNANVSTAREIAELAKVALSMPEISEPTLMKKYEFKTLEGRKKIVYNTDDLLDLFPQNGLSILGGKTGYTEAAGYCFVGRFVDHSGHEIISVVLGEGSNDGRFRETHDLVNWVYKNYQWSR